MAKKSKRASGPFLAAALFCDQTIRGQDGTTSVIRIIDQISMELPGDAPRDVPSKKKPLMAEVASVLAFRTGYSSGDSRKVRLVLESPSGEQLTDLEKEVSFSKSPSGGATFRFNMQIPVVESGVYWVRVSLDGNPIAHMPLTVKVSRQAEPKVQTSPPKRKRAKKNSSAGKK